MHFLIKITLLICSLIISYNVAFAQVSGFQGKRLLLKTELTNYILASGYSVELESILLRDITVSVDYAVRTNLDVGNKYNKDLVSYSGKTVGLKIRSYLNKAVPAPLGVYSFLLGRYGSVDIEGILDSESSRPKDLSFSDVPFLQVGIGWGYQTIIADRISLDASWVLVQTHYDYNSEVPWAFQRFYGENFLYLTQAPRSYDHYGISIKVSVGILLF